MSNEFWGGTAVAGEIIYPPGGTFGPRYQGTYQFVLIHSGHVTVWIDGEKHFTEAQSVFLLYPDHEEYFAFAEKNETWHTWLNIPTVNVDSSLVARLQRLDWALPLSPTFHQLMREALTAQRTPFPTSRELLLTLGMQMLWRYLGEGELRITRQTRRISPAVEQAQQFIYEHLGEELTLGAIAQVAAVSPAHLIRLFGEQVQMTPIAYLWQQRVKRGIELLEQTGMSVGAIAYRCGFQSRFHFSRRVREAVGYAPLEIRQRSWQRGQPREALLQAPEASDEPER